MPMRRALVKEAEQLVAQATAQWSGCVSSMPDAVKAERELDAEIIRLRTDAQFQIDDQLQATHSRCEKRLGEAKIGLIDGCMLPTSRLSTALSGLGERWKRSASGESASSNN